MATAVVELVCLAAEGVCCGGAEEFSCRTYLEMVGDLGSVAEGVGDCGRPAEDVVGGMGSFRAVFSVGGCGGRAA